MRVDIRFFASLREALGEGEALEVTPGTTVAAVREGLAQRGAPYAEVLGPQRAVRCAWNRQLVTEDTQINQAGELAFFPPVTGG